MVGDLVGRLALGPGQFCSADDLQTGRVNQIQVTDEVRRPDAFFRNRQRRIQPSADMGELKVPAFGLKQSRDAGLPHHCPS